MNTEPELLNERLERLAMVFDEIMPNCALLVRDALALLKEQEAVEPICQIIFDVPYYFCGNCKTMLNMYATKAKYCSQCKRKVKWE